MEKSLRGFKRQDVLLQSWGSMGRGVQTLSVSKNSSSAMTSGLAWREGLNTTTSDTPAAAHSTQKEPSDNGTW